MYNTEIWQHIHGQWPLHGVWYSLALPAGWSALDRTTAELHAVGVKNVRHSNQKYIFMCFHTCSRPIGVSMRLLGLFEMSVMRHWQR